MSSYLSSGVNATFQYDALGRRVSKTINGVTTSYLYDRNNIVQEIGGSAVGANYVRSLNIDEPFVRQVSAGNEYYHTDALGSSLALSNAAGVSAASYSYEAFGKTIITGTSSNPFQYTGRENDGTGLYYYRARYFNLQGHRFIAEDPIEFQSGDTNFYAYARNRPTAFTDPYGEAIPPLIIAGAAFGAGINASAYLVSYYFSGDPFDPGALGAAVLNGAITGALSGIAGPLGGSFAKVLNQGSAGALAKVGTGLWSGVSSAVGQYVTNQITGRKDSVGCAAGFGAAGGIVGSFIPNKVANTLKQAARFSPSLKNLLTFGSPQSVAISGSTVLGNVVGAGSGVCN